LGKPDISHFLKEWFFTPQLRRGAAGYDSGRGPRNGKLRRFFAMGEHVTAGWSDDVLVSWEVEMSWVTLWQYNIAIENGHL